MDSHRNLWALILDANQRQPIRGRNETRGFRSHAKESLSHLTDPHFAKSTPDDRPGHEPHHLVEESIALELDDCNRRSPPHPYPANRPNRRRGRFPTIRRRRRQSRAGQQIPGCRLSATCHRAHQSRARHGRVRRAKAPGSLRFGSGRFCRGPRSGHEKSVETNRQRRIRICGGSDAFTAAARTVGSSLVDRSTCAHCPSAWTPASVRPAPCTRIFCPATLAKAVSRRS